MKVLLDHCVPRPLAKSIVDHEVRTARSMGWEDLSNGKLLAAAACEFDVLVTTDRNVQSQQSASRLPLPVVVLRGQTNTIEDLAGLVQSC